MGTLENYQSIKTELAGHILDKINDGILDDTNKDDWHFLAFNEDYYIIGYYQAEEWLKRHNMSTFDAINICQEYERDNFGEARIYDNAEATVNMLAYIFGEELIYSEDFDDIGHLETEMNEILN